MNFLGMFTQTIIPLCIKAVLSKAKEVKPKVIAEDPVTSAEWDKLFTSLEANSDGICHICERAATHAIPATAAASEAEKVVNDF